MIELGALALRTRLEQPFPIIPRHVLDVQGIVRGKMQLVRFSEVVPVV